MTAGGPFRILGIDPGYGRLGYAVLEKNGPEQTLLDAGDIETFADQRYEKRIQKLGRELKKIMEKYDPEILALEKIFFNSNQKTAMKVAETRGLAIYLAGNASIYEFSPPEIKLAVCGYGRADKKQVGKMIKLIFKKNILPQKDDALDAVAIALCASARI